MIDGTCRCRPWTGTLEYMSGVQNALTERLKQPIATEEESFLYQLTTFHEDMHDEAFTYTRQTLEYPQPRFAAEHVPADAAAGPLPGDVEIPGGSFMLGSFPTAPFAFDNEKWAHRRQRSAVPHGARRGHQCRVRGVCR